VYKNAETNAEKAQVADWLKLNPKEMTGIMTSMPTGDNMPFNISLLVEYYSK
jgi:ribosomal protein S4